MAFDLSTLKTLLKKERGPSGNERAFLGIDIGASAIKIVQLKNVRNVPTLETYGELQLGPYESIDIGRGTRLPQNKLIEALIDILRESSATSTSATYSFSYNTSFTNTISIPTINQEQIASMLPIEARKYIPISLSKVTLDWIPLGINEKNKETKILLTAIYNDAIEKYNAVLQGAKLTTVASELEIFSSIRSVVSQSDEVVVILDWGATATRMYIIEKGVVRKTHSVLMSGITLTEGIAQDLNIDFIEAEEIKRTYGLLGKTDEPRVQKSLTKEIERGLRELHTVSARYERDEGVCAKKIIMSGGGSVLKGLDVFVQDVLSLPVERANPFNKVAYPAFLEDTLQAVGPSFSIAVGTALRAMQNLK